MLVRPRLSRIYYRRRFFDYPLKLSIGMLANLGWFEAALLGASYTRARILPRSPEATLEDFFINRFGERLYLTFFKDYTEKVWGVPCREISAEWGAQRIKGLSITSALAHALRGAIGRRKDVAQKGVETSLIERFLYPRLGPGQMWEEVRDRVVAAGGQVHLRHAVVGIDHAGESVRRVRVRDLESMEERWVDCDAMISTMPIRQLVEQLCPDEPGLRRIAHGLPYRDFMTAGLVVRGMTTARPGGGVEPAATPKDNWIYIQEPDVQLGRLQIFNNWSPDLVADPGTVSLGLEYFCREGDDLWSMADGDFLDFAARELEKIGLIDRRQVLDGTVVRVPKAYPAYFGEYQRDRPDSGLPVVVCKPVPGRAQRHAPVQQPGSLDARGPDRGRLPAERHEGPDRALVDQYRRRRTTSSGVTLRVPWKLTRNERPMRWPERCRAG